MGHLWSFFCCLSSEANALPIFSVNVPTVSAFCVEALVSDASNMYLVYLFNLVCLRILRALLRGRGSQGVLQRLLAETPGSFGRAATWM